MEVWETWHAVGMADMGEWWKVRQEVVGQDQVTEGPAEQGKESGLCLMDFREPIKGH